MENKKYYLAIDIGASSGRHIVGYKREDGFIESFEVYRFKNGVKNIDNHLTWDVDYLQEEVIKGIAIALNKYPSIESMSIDTWGVDYVLLDKDNKPIYPVYAYRDNRTKEAIKEVHKLISPERLYKLTGSQFQTFNTIYQLYDDKLKKRLDKATDYLMIPEYLMFCLTGIKKYELTNRGTTGMYDPNSFRIVKEIVDKLKLPNFVNQEVSKPGEVIGYLKDDIAKKVGKNIKVKLCLTHDTASAVNSLDMEKDDIYVSSGTWSLIGIKSQTPIISDKGRIANYSNEFGDTYIRFQKNIMGLWIIQKLQEIVNVDFIEMVNMARKSSYQEIFDVNDEMFLSPKDMKKAIYDYFVNHNQSTPKDDNDYINSTYHSLAYSYKIAIDELEKITNRKFNNIVVTGGGAKNSYLNELIEKYCNKKVVAIPIEATAIGNIKAQMEE